LYTQDTEASNPSTNTISSWDAICVLARRTFPELIVDLGREAETLNLLDLAVNMGMIADQDDM
jgi:hypothetical protein